jgi:hypothetical protein
MEEGGWQEHTSIIRNLEDLSRLSVKVLIAEVFLIAVERLRRNEGYPELLEDCPGVPMKRDPLCREQDQQES